VGLRRTRWGKARLVGRDVPASDATTGCGVDISTGTADVHRKYGHERQRPAAIHGRDGRLHASIPGAEALRHNDNKPRWKLPGLMIEGMESDATSAPGKGNYHHREDTGGKARPPARRCPQLSCANRAAASAL